MGSTDYLLIRRAHHQDNPSGHLDRLTARERDAVRHACAGATNKQIAFRMGVSSSTVAVLLWRARRKLGVIDRDDLILAFALRRR